MSKDNKDTKDILKEYNEALNNNTAKHIVDALCTYEKLIERTKISIDKNNKHLIHIVFLFSGKTPDCEYEICKIIKTLIFLLFVEIISIGVWL